jgi:hypothetical protein
MVREDLAGDQEDELGQHRSQSRNGDRRRGHCAVDRGGRERRAAHVRWLQASPCPDRSAGRPDVLEQPRDQAARTRLRICRSEAVPDLQPALGLRTAPGPVVAVVLASAVAVVLAPAVEVILVFAPAVEVIFAPAVEVVFAPAVEVVLVPTSGVGGRCGYRDALGPRTRSRIGGSAAN